MRMSIGMRKMTCVVTVDFICICIVGLPCLLLNLIGEPYKRGFFCSDTSIRHPFQESTVPTWALIMISYSLPTIIIALVETSLLKHSNTFSSVRLTREMYNTLGLFVFGSFVNQLMTDISKYTIGNTRRTWRKTPRAYQLFSGRLRPHFLTVCSPNVTLSEGLCGDLDSPQYVTEFNCLGQQDITAAERGARLHGNNLGSHI